MSPASPHAPQTGEITLARAYSDKQRFVVGIEGAKTDETRQRRTAKVVARLSEGRT